jgi:putative thioredoxin
VLIDFWAPWCGPCKQLTPVIEKAVRAAKGKVKLVKMNIDEHPAIPGQMGIQSIPAVIAFVNGQPADGFMGAVPESQVTAFIDKLTKGMPSPEGDIAEVLKRPKPPWRRAIPPPLPRSMPRCFRSMPPTSRLLPGWPAAMSRRALLSRPSRHWRWFRVQAQRRCDCCRADRARSRRAGEGCRSGTELEQKVAANPMDHQARFDLAVALNAGGKRAEAASHLLDIVRRDRKWDDDGARRKLVQFFEAWGPDDDATMDARKRLSTILFS